MINRIVGYGQRAVAAGIFHLELVIGVDLFASVDGHHHGLAVLRVDAAAVGIEDVFGVDQIAMIAEQPVDAIGIAALFVGGKRDDDVAIRAIVFLGEANQRGDVDRVAVLHVLRAAAVGVAVFFDELEGIGGPIEAWGFDDVEMADHQDRAVGSGAAKARDHIFATDAWAEDLDVARGNSGVAEALGHGFAGGGRAADGIGGVDFDELAEDVASELTRRIAELRAKRRAG